MRRAIYECWMCSRHCTVRTHSTERPTKCLFWVDCPQWFRVDKHSQKQIGEWDE